MFLHIASTIRGSVAGADFAAVAGRRPSLVSGVASGAGAITSSGARAFGTGMAGEGTTAGGGAITSAGARAFGTGMAGEGTTAGGGTITSAGARAFGTGMAWVGTASGGGTITSAGAFGGGRVWAAEDDPVLARGCSGDIELLMPHLLPPPTNLKNKLEWGGGRAVSNNSKSCKIM